MQEKPENRFYVYVYLDPRKLGKYIYTDCEFEFEPFYIGKGEGKRNEDHIKEAKKILEICLKTNIKISKKNFPKINTHKIHKILKIQREIGQHPIIIKIKHDLLEKDAFELETQYIQTIGRKDLKKG